MAHKSPIHIDTRNNKITGSLLALCAFALYSAHDVFVKLLGGHYHAAQIVFFANLFSLLLIVIMLMRDRVEANLRPKNRVAVGLRSGAMVVMGLGAFYAFSVLPMAQTYAILFATPLLITLLSMVFLGEKVAIDRMVAVMVGLVGVLIVLRPGSSGLNLGHLGAGLSMAASSMNSIIMRKVGGQERPVVMILYPVVATCLVMGLLLPFVYKPMPIGHVGMMGAIALLSILGMILALAAYRRSAAALVAPMQYSQMIWAVFWGALVFNESVDTQTIIGAGVIILSGLYIVFRARSPA